MKESIFGAHDDPHVRASHHSDSPLGPRFRNSNSAERDVTAAIVSLIHCPICACVCQMNSFFEIDERRCAVRHWSRSKCVQRPGVIFHISDPRDRGHRRVRRRRRPPAAGFARAAKLVVLGKTNLLHQSRPGFEPKFQESESCVLTAALSGLLRCERAITRALR